MSKPEFRSLITNSQGVFASPPTSAYNSVMTESLKKTSDGNSHRWFRTVWWILVILCSAIEIQRVVSAFADEQTNNLTWLFFWNIETTAPLLVLLSAALLLRPTKPADHNQPTHNTGNNAISGVLNHRIVATQTLCVFVVALAGSWFIGAKPIDVRSTYEKRTLQFADLPPAYHDEYSYLLQADTFLAGRLSYPEVKNHPELFHQFHVLNERRTVSRYFPWTGAWIAAAKSLTNPVHGHWVAGALATSFFYLAMLQLAGTQAAFVGALLIAVSPGISIFSNMLLAHHPTLVALALFLCAFVRMMTTQQVRWAFVAGIGLTLAMLGRPMTAAGFALPFGIWLITFVWRERSHWKLMTGFAVPLMVGFVVLGVMNQNATGQWTRTAYQEYTERYTPRHRFGFHNAEEAPGRNGPAAVQKYDQWAGENNLTLKTALQNVGKRLQASLHWSLGIIPALFGLLMALPLLLSRNSGMKSPLSPDFTSEQRTGLRLLAFGILSLHSVHVPYWYAGIMDWHYVFETAPLILLLVGFGCTQAVRHLRQHVAQTTAVLWICLLMLAALIPGWVRLPMFAGTSKVDAAVSQLAFSRTRIETFRHAVQGKQVQKPALVMVDESESDPQLSYILNPPDYDSAVLVCRLPEDKSVIDELRSEFPDRHFYVFQPQQMQFEFFAPEVSSTHE